MTPSPASVLSALILRGFGFTCIALAGTLLSACSAPSTVREQDGRVVVKPGRLATVTVTIDGEKVTVDSRQPNFIESITGGVTRGLFGFLTKEGDKQ